MSTTQIFSHDIGSANFQVWVTNGIVQYAINGNIQHDITSVSEFLAAAAKAINKPNTQDDMVIEASGNINDNALENFDDEDGVVFDTGGQAPSINLQDDDTEVKISGSGVGGQFRADFGSGTNAQAEAAAFLEFANDLLGKATATEIDQLSGIQIGHFMRTVTISERDDDITQIKFKSTGENRDLTWADRLVEFMAEDLDGVRTKNGNVGEGNTSLNPAQVKISEDGLSVDLGSQGVGGKEVWEFMYKQDAIDFRDQLLDTLGPRR